MNPGKWTQKNECILWQRTQHVLWPQSIPVLRERKKRKQGARRWMYKHVVTQYTAVKKKWHWEHTHTRTHTFNVVTGQGTLIDMLDFLISNSLEDWTFSSYRISAESMNELGQKWISYEYTSNEYLLTVSVKSVLCFSVYFANKQAELALKSISEF